MGIRFFCPNGHKLNVKEFQAGRKGICPYCGAKTQIPTQSTRGSSKEERAARRAGGAGRGPMATPEMYMPTSAAAIAPAAAPTGPFGDRPHQEVGTWPATAPFQAAPASAGPMLSAPSQLAPVQSMPMLSAPSQPALAMAAGPSSAAVAPPAAPGAADPLTEAGDVVWYVRHPSAGQFGPATRQIMQAWLTEGRVSPDSLVWREGWRDWQPAADVFPQLAPKDSFQGLEAIIASEPLPTYTAPHAHRPAARRQLKSTQALIIVALIAAVIILAVVFALVLFR